jgi:single-strand DNA-binding protein
LDQREINNRASKQRMVNTETTMGNKFTGEGNLGQDPVLKRTGGDDDEKAVCNLRIYFDRPVPKDEGGFDDKGGFWMDVEIWGKRAVACASLLIKGSRVVVEGSLIGQSWKGDDDQDHYKVIVRAKRVSPDLMIVGSIKSKA